jgi:hypothetical protein
VKSLGWQASAGSLLEALDQRVLVADLASLLLDLVLEPSLCEQGITRFSSHAKGALLLDIVIGRVLLAGYLWRLVRVLQLGVPPVA